MAAENKTDFLAAQLKGIERVQRFWNVNNLTKAEIAKINATMKDPAVIRDALFSTLFSLNMTTLSEPEREAQEAFADAINTAREGLVRYVSNSYPNRTQDSPMEDIKKEVKAVVKALNKVDNLEFKVLSQINQTLATHPEYAPAIRYTVMVTPNVLNRRVLDFVDLCFSYSNDAFPDLSDQLVYLTEITQHTYDLFPLDFYKQLQKAFAGKGF
ncbi:hypothetical protein DSO57_1011096 [Entomophthora muscae]|uniref:Uncharacterized protein n=1 Tax=Entomophthora muscae TaxID=34485 RepID=A0ACC2T6T6_9FUNG|nr:hypothetical protein DSO57_1011096 [Entomophthora muscae]